MNIGSKRIKAPTKLHLSCPIRFWTEKPTLECQMNIHHLLFLHFFPHFVRNTSISTFPNPFPCLLDMSKFPALPLPLPDHLFATQKQLKTCELTKYLRINTDGPQLSSNGFHYT